jgi:Fe-S-cluster containining protein
VNFDCQSCGACCSPAYDDDDRYVELEERDRKRLPWPRRNLLVLTETETVPALSETVTRSWIRTRVNRDGDLVCSCLTGKVGGRVACSVYEKRPEICRAFRPGSSMCIQSRVVEGIHVR